MSNKNKKNKKPARRISEDTLAKIKLAFGTLFKNDACVNAGRNWKGVSGNALPIGLAILGVVVSLIPGLAGRLNANYGNEMVNNPSYSYDIGLSTFTDALANNGAHIEIENGSIKVTNWDAVANYTATSSGAKWYQATSTATGKVMFEAFVNTSDALPNASFEPGQEDAAFFSRILSNLEPAKGDSVPNRTVIDSVAVSYTTNVIAFGKTSILFSKVNPSTGAASSYYGVYDRLEGKDVASLAPAATVKGDARIVASSEAWKGYINEAMETIKITTAWSYVGILGAIDAGLVLLFGFVLWLVCRGKNNPFRIYNLWETEKIAYWAALAPGLLSLVMGFIIPSYALLFFIFLYGMRIMWMSMRSLRPIA